jgi:hypothetical protein
LTIDLHWKEYLRRCFLDKKEEKTQKGKVPSFVLFDFSGMLLIAQPTGEQ